MWGSTPADSEKPAKAEKDLPECLQNARDDVPLEQQFSLRELSGLSKEEADALDLTLKPMPQPAPAAEPAAPAVPQEPAADQTVRVETAQPAAPADDSTVRLMPGAVPVPTPAEDHTERVAVPLETLTQRMQVLLAGAELPAALRPDTLTLRLIEQWAAVGLKRSVLVSVQDALVDE